MMVLVTYDVSTKTPAGQRRLARVAKPDQWVELRAKLIELIEPEEDSLRFYFLGNNWRHRVEHVGAKPSLDLEGPLLI